MTDQPLIVGPRGETPDEIRAVDEDQPQTLQAALARAAADPRIDVEKMTKLFDLHQRIVEDQRKASFKAALARLQAKLPMISKDGQVIKDGVVLWRYAKREHIHEIIQPLLAEEGFALSFNEEELIGQASRRFSCTLSHRDGHSETKYKTVPFDASNKRSAAQSEGSTATYAMRYLTKMQLGIVEKDEDDDGMGGGSEPITNDDALNIQALIDEAQPDPEARKVLKEGFLKYMGVAQIADITTRDYKKAVNALQEKIRRRTP